MAVVNHHYALWVFAWFCSLIRGWGSNVCRYEKTIVEMIPSPNVCDLRMASGMKETEYKTMMTTTVKSAVCVCVCFLYVKH